MTDHKKTINDIGLIEPILQELRIRKAMSHIPKDGVLVDVGCDDPPKLLNRIHLQMKKCMGLDIVVEPRREGNILILKQDLQKKIDLPNDTADVVTLLAVLEHMKYPEEIVQECFRILKPGGVLLVTVPSPQNKPLLNFFAVFLLVRREMIHQHENYFTHEKLRKICKDARFREIVVESFELGFNTFIRAVK